VGKGKRADVYLEVRKRMGHIFFEAFKIQIIVPMQIIKICSTPNY
jgi:hypothetical protein